MADKAADRLVWTVECMNVRPADTVLEIGCGYGVCVDLIREKLSAPTIVAVDRSPKMVAAARRRNPDAEIVVAEFAELRLRRRFDKILAIHVPVLLRGDPTTELQVVRDHLQPSGRLYVGYQPLDASTVDAEQARLESVLTDRGFAVQTRRADLQSGTTLCLIAAPTRPIR